MGRRDENQRSNPLKIRSASFDQFSNFAIPLIHQPPSHPEVVEPLASDVGLSHPVPLAWLHRKSWDGISLRARRLDSDPLTGFVRQSEPEGRPRWAALVRRARSILLRAKALGRTILTTSASLAPAPAAHSLRPRGEGHGARSRC